MMLCSRGGGAASTSSACSSSACSSSSSSSRKVANAKRVVRRVRIVVESGGTKNYPKLALRGEKIRTTAFVSGGGGGGGRMLFPLAPGRAKDERNQSEILLRAISEPRKSASTEDEVTAETKTGSQRATTPSSSSKSSSSAGKKKTFVANNNKKKKNSGKKTKGYSSSRNYKPFKPTSSKVSNARRKKFAPLIAGVADDVPLNELLKKYPNFEDCLGPKKYDSGHFIRLYSDLVRCDRLGDAIDLLQRLSDAKVPCLNDTRIRKYGTVDFLVSCERSNKLKNSPVMHAFTFTNLVLEASRDDLSTAEVATIYNKLLAVCSAHGNCDAAAKAFEQMKQDPKGLTIDVITHTSMIVAYSKAGKIDLAFEQFETMTKKDKIEPTIVTYGALMDAVSREIGRRSGNGGFKSNNKKDISYVKDALDRVFNLRLDLEASGLQMDVRVLNCLVSACGRAAAFEELRSDALDRAFDIVAESRRNGLFPDAVTYSSLMSGCVNACEPQRALALYDEMEIKGVARTASVYSTAIHACAAEYDYENSAPNFRKAFKIWEEVQGNEPRVMVDSVLYATMLTVASRAGNVEMCANLIREMEMNGSMMSPAVVSTMCGSFARAGDAGAVDRILSDAEKSNGVVPRACYNALINSCARDTDFEGAMKAYDRLVESGQSPDEITFEGLILAAAKKPETLTEAKKLLQEAMDMGLRPTLPTYNALVRGFGRSGDLNETYATVKAMKDAGYTPDEMTWRELLFSCARHGNCLLAWDAYKSSREAGIAPCEVTLNTIIGAILAHIRTLTDPTRLASDKPGHGLTDTSTSGEISTSVAQPAWKEWSDRATAVFHEAITHGVKPRVETFSSMLACLRPPTDQEVQLAEKYGGESLARLVTHQSNVHEDAATYYPTKALILFEEAQAIGIVPKFEMSEDSEYDMRNFPPAAAEVALLTLIRKIKRHVEAFGEKDLKNRLPTFTLLLRAKPEMLVDKDGYLVSSSTDESLAGQGATRRLERSGERLVVLLRRLRINYAGSLEKGRIELSSHIMYRWIHGKSSAPHALPGMEARLADDITMQAMRIRSTDVMSGRGTIDHYGNDSDEGSTFIPGYRAPVFRNPNANYSRSEGGQAGGRWSRSGWSQNSYDDIPSDQHLSMDDLDDLIKNRE